MNANANAMGIAITSLLRPTKASTAHSAIKPEVITEAISQRAANALCPLEVLHQFFEYRHPSLVLSLGTQAAVEVCHRFLQ